MANELTWTMPFKNGMADHKLVEAKDVFIIINGTEVGLDTILQGKVDVVSNPDDGKQYVMTKNGWAEVVISLSANDISYTDNKGLDADNAQDAIDAVSDKCDNKQAKRSTITPVYEKLTGYVVTISSDSESGVVDWRENTEPLYVIVENCPNEIIIYFDGDTEFYDTASLRLGDTVEIESGKTYIASYLDGIVAVAEVQEIE